jgi:integrase
MFEQVARRHMSSRTVRETVAGLYREIYNETLPTVRQCVESWLATKGPEVSPGTLAFYRRSTDKFLEFLGSAADLDLVSVTKTAVVEFRNAIAKKSSSVTTNADLKTVKMLFRAAKRDGYIIQDPSEFVDYVRRSSQDERRPFTIGEIKAVLAVADPEWKSLVLFGLYTGQRLGDIATLNWKNIDLSKNEIRVKTRKTGKRLTIPIAAPLRKYIDSLPEGDQSAGPVHPRAFEMIRRHGRSGNISNQFSDVLALAGLRKKRTHKSTGKGRSGRHKSHDLSFHSLRHTAVSLLKDAGIPQAVVQELIGHDSEAMSALYTHVGMDALVKAAAALPEV